MEYQIIGLTVGIIMSALLMPIALGVLFDTSNNVCVENDPFTHDVDTTTYRGLDISGTSIIGEKIDTDSVFNGLTITKMSFYFTRFNSSNMETPAFSRVGVWDSDGVLLQDFGQINLLTMSNGLHEFTFEDGYTLSTGEYIGVRLPTNANQEVAIAVTKSETFNALHTIFSQHEGGLEPQWINDDGADIYFVVTDIDNNTYTNQLSGGNSNNSCDSSISMLLLIAPLSLLIILILLIRKVKEK